MGTGLFQCDLSPYGRVYEYRFDLFSLQSLLLMLLLMFIGGAAQSTAGGVKVNAFAAAVLSLFAVIRGKSRVEVFRRQLSVDSIRRSNATLVMYLMILFLGVFVLSVLEPHASLLALVFECTSALSTVGSSLGPVSYTHLTLPTICSV